MRQTKRPAKKQINKKRRTEMGNLRRADVSNRAIIIDSIVVARKRGTSARARWRLDPIRCFSRLEERSSNLSLIVKDGRI